MPPAFATPDELRAYAAGDVGWSTLRDRGVGYSDVLAGLGALGLRPPLAPMAGPNLDARVRGVRQLGEALAAARS